MIALPGYQIIPKIYESAKSHVYRGIRKQDNKPVILKVLKQDYPTPGELTRYKQEYSLLRGLNIHGVIEAYDLQLVKNTLVMILEDFGGDSLLSAIGERQFTLSEWISSFALPRFWVNSTRLRLPRSSTKTLTLPISSSIPPQES